MTMCDAHMNQLKARWNLWNDCLNGDDVNSISNQLTRMTWDITAFRVLVEAHQLACKRDGNARRLNGFSFRLLHECFSESLLLSFRRLMGKEKIDDRKRGVYSLRSLLDDLSSHSHLLTREAVVRVTNESLEDRSERFLRDMETSMNKIIDQMIGVEEKNRLPTEVIPKKIFDDKREELDKRFESVEILVNKLIAHAATPTSRQNGDFQPPFFEELYTFHEKLCRTAHFLQRLIATALDSSFLPTISPDHEEYKGLARALISDEDISGLEGRWKGFAEQYESWSSK